MWAAILFIEAALTAWPCGRDGFKEEDVVGCTDDAIQIAMSFNVPPNNIQELLDNGIPSEDIIVMKYNEDHELFEVTDEDELNEAEEVLEAYNEDPSIQEIKDND